MIKRPGAILALLTGLNLLNYLDRLVVSAVLPRLMAELGFSNFEGGLLATVFLVGYFLTAPIFGALGDRLPRKHLIAIGVLVWSAATIGSGVVNGVVALLAVRAMVGVGEASYATLAPTIIDDITPPERKGRALAIFYLATPLGAALGYIIGGQIEKHFGWRAAFYVAGGPGVVLALVCLAIAEPVRKIREKNNALKDLATLVKVPLYRKGVIGFCAYTAAIGAFSFWAPQFLFVRYHLSLALANTVFGGILVGAGIAGTVIGGRWADASVRKLELAQPKEKDYRAQAVRPASPEDEATLAHARVNALLKVCAIGSLVGAPLAAAAFLSPTPTIFFVFAALAILFLFLCTSPINAVVLQAVPTELRASAMALSIFSIHVFGDLWSPPFVGILADSLPIQLAMMTLPLAIGLSALMWWPKRDKSPGS